MGSSSSILARAHNGSHDRGRPRATVSPAQGLALGVPGQAVLLRRENLGANDEAVVPKSSDMIATHLNGANANAQSRVSLTRAREATRGGQRVRIKASQHKVLGSDKEMTLIGYGGCQKADGSFPAGDTHGNTCQQIPTERSAADKESCKTLCLDNDNCFAIQLGIIG